MAGAVLGSCRTSSESGFKLFKQFLQNEMGNLMMLLEVRVESIPGAVRELVISRPGVSWEWRAELLALLDQRPAPAMLVEYLVRLFQRQRPTEAASVGLLSLAAVVRMALARANEEPEDWEWAQEVA